MLADQAHVLEQIVRGAPLGDVLASLCRIVETTAPRAVRASIFLVDDDGKRLRVGAAPSLPDAYNAALDGVPIDPDLGTCCAAAARAQVVVTPDIECAPSWTAFKHLPLGQKLLAAWSMPIMSSTHTVLGTIGTYFLEKREPTAAEREVVEVVSRTAALAIERDRSDRTLRESARRHKLVFDLDHATQSSSDPVELVKTAARMLAEYLEVDRCAYAEVIDEKSVRVAGDHARRLASIVGVWDVAAFGPAFVAAVEQRVPYTVDDAETSPGLDEASRATFRLMSVRAGIAVPLYKDGRFTACMAVHHATPRAWQNQDVEVVSLVAARCWEALERMRVTRELQESEARYRTMVQASPECVKVVAPNGTLLQMNDAGLQMIEATPATAIGRSVYPLIVPEHRERFAQFNEAVCGGTPGKLTFDLVGLGGTRRTMETTAVPLPTTLGGNVHLALTRDVTERAEIERALVESRSRLDYAVRLSRVGFWYCDLPFQDLIWDARCKDHFFLPPDAHVDIDLFYARMHPDDREPTRQAIDHSIGSHASYDVVYRTVDPATGACKYIRALGGAAYASDGTPLRFDGVTVDVTEQKRDEERLARLADAAIAIHSAGTLDSVLSEITEQARALIGAHQGVSSLTINDDFAQAINAVSLSEKYAEFRTYKAKITGAGIYSVVAQYNRPMRMTQAELEAHPRWRGFSKEGAKHPPMRGWLAVPFVARDGRNLGIIQLSDKVEGDFTATDEAVLVQLAQLASVAIENTRLNAELREQDRRKDEFLATLAHELRNPLAPIRTGLQVLQQGAADPPRIHGMMDRQLGHLVRIVDDLLDISRITLGKVRLEKSRVDLRSVLESAVETTRPLLTAQRHTLVLELPAEALPIEVDPTRLGQVFANLINNAAKYTPSGGRITISADVSAGSLHVRVTDTGLGIPREMLPRVFDMFTQVGRSIERSQGGLGIGLTLVRRLVEMHGGAVDADSPGLNAGSTFTVHLPLAEPLADMPATHAVVKATPTNGLRVLVVDDNVDAAEMLAMLLEADGHTTQLAHNGVEALAAAGTMQPDVVFLDIGLPEMNGYEVATRLRGNAAMPQPMLVALTGWGSEEDRRLAHDAGFDRHLVKPIAAEKIRAVLASASAV